MLQQQVQQQVQQQAVEQAHPQQVPLGPVPLFPKGQSQEKLPEPPSLGSDEINEDNKITFKMFSMYWLKVQMLIALVEGRISPQRYPALIANHLKGKAADAVWLGGGEALTKDGGLMLMKNLLEVVFYGDQTAAISSQVSDVFDFHRPSHMSLRDYSTEMRSRLRQLDARGEVIPPQTRGHILLNNAGLSADQRGLVLATTQRNMAFNPIADALCLLFVNIKPRNAPGHSYFGQHTDS